MKEHRRLEVLFHPFITTKIDAGVFLKKGDTRSP
jgi:hypothetical protein